MSFTSSSGLSIGAVEHETGLSQDTLRMWERRYRFPSPDRDTLGERSYPTEQVDKLRLIRHLMDHGHRPGKLVGADLSLLRDMAASLPDGSPRADIPPGSQENLMHFVALCKAHRVEDLRRELMQHMLRVGMHHFVMGLIAPLTATIGTQWANGNLAVSDEHLYTESVQAVMRSAIAAVPLAGSGMESLPRPRIVLGTVTNEPHGLGLLMSEAIFTLEGAHCVSVGVQAPVTQIAAAARAQAADIVALSFSASAAAALVVEALADLRAELPQSVEIWVGGRCAALRRRSLPDIRRLELHEIPAAISAWRLRTGV